MLDFARLMARNSVRDVSLTVLLVLQLYFLFFLQPAASIGIDFGLPRIEVVFIAVVVVVMLVSPSRGAGVATALTLLTASVAIIMRRRLLSPATDCLNRSRRAWGSRCNKLGRCAFRLFTRTDLTTHRLRGAFGPDFNIALVFN